MRGLGKKLIRNLVLFVAVTLVVECFGISCNTAKAAIIIPQTKFMFDGEYYANSNPDIVAKLGDNYDTLLNHYLNSGKWEGRLPYPGATPYIPVEDVDDGIYKASGGVRKRGKEGCLNRMFFELGVGFSEELPRLFLV